MRAVGGLKRRNGWLSSDCCLDLLVSRLCVPALAAQNVARLN